MSVDRKLAHIEQIAWIRPIEGADRIELVGILGWQCVAKKGEFNKGQLCCYFEIDSKLPEAEWSEFMRDSKFRVKTKKMRGEYSQGLAIPVDILGWTEIKDEDGLYQYVLTDKKEKLNIGDDVTDLLGVRYYIEEDNVRKAKDPSPEDKYKNMTLRNPKIFNKPIVKWFMKHKLGRKLIFLLFGRKRDRPANEKTFPTKFRYIYKTDETRVEAFPLTFLENKEKWIQTTKIDGTSATYILERIKKNKFEFYVLSRNIRQMTPDQKTYHKDNVYWNMEFKYHVKDFLMDQLNKHPEYEYVCLQGEIAGEGVQGNPHKLKDTQLFGFNFIDSVHGRWNSVEAKELCEPYGIQWVPIISTDYVLPDTMEELKKQADGDCEVPGSSGLREGFVYRSLDGKRSFKNVSRKYLIKHDQ